MRNKHGQLLIKVACPIKGIACTAKKPRWIDKFTFTKERRGVCSSCGRGKYRTLQEVQKIVPKAIALKYVKWPYRYRSYDRGRAHGPKILIVCPKKGFGCIAKKPRWLWFQTAKNNQGVCLSCGRFKGGWTDKNGYNITQQGAVHRLIKAKALGRSLRSDEDVHHKNLIRADNRLSNLQLKWHHHGRGALVTDLIAYLRETGYIVKRKRV